MMTKSGYRINDASLEEWAKTALEIQDASNLCAVAGVFHDWLRWRVRHPDSFLADTAAMVSLTLLDKINQLAGRPSQGAVHRAFHDLGDFINDSAE